MLYLLRHLCSFNKKVFFPISLNLKDKKSRSDEYNILTNFRVNMLLRVHTVCVLRLIRNNARRSRGEKA